MVSLAEELKSTLPSCSVSKSIIWNDQENVCHSFQPSSLDYVQFLVFNIKVSKISIWFSLYWRNICPTFWPPLLDFVRFFVLFWLRHQRYAYQVLFWCCRGGRFLISDHYLQWFCAIFPWQQDLNLDKCVSCFLLKVFWFFLRYFKQIAIPESKYLFGYYNGSATHAAPKHLLYLHIRRVLMGLVFQDWSHSLWGTKNVLKDTINSLVGADLVFQYTSNEVVFWYTTDDPTAFKL